MIGIILTLAVVGFIVFIFSGIVSLAKFLQLHPVPDVLQKNLATAQAENTLSRDAAIRAGRAIFDAGQQAERERLTAPGPCGKHPAMFYHEHADSCFSKVPETEGNGSYLRCQMTAGCILCAEIAKVEAERDIFKAALPIGHALAIKKIEQLEADNAALREALRAVKAYFWASGPGVMSEGDVQSLVESVLLASPQPAAPKRMCLMCGSNFPGHGDCREVLP